MTGIWIVLCFVCFLIGGLAGIALTGLLNASKDFDYEDSENDIYKDGDEL